MRTPLYDEIVAMNARMIDFHGWEMPIQFSSIIEEHLHVRSKAGLFDVSHMGDIFIRGKDSESFVDYIFPTQISKQPVGKAIYSAYLNNDANMIDDTIIYKISEDKYLVIPNAATTKKVYDWLVSNKNGYKVSIENLSDKLSCLALQGPQSPSVIEGIFPDALGLDHFTFLSAYQKYKEPGLEDAVLVGRTGYTGEDGFEFIIPNKYAVPLWREILSNNIVKPVGLGARDTLRMEKGFLLSGQDFNEDRTPIEAGISWIINWDHEFIGKNKLQEKKKSRERFRGLISLDKIIPRAGSPVIKDGENIGILTSGSYSPTLGKGIGLGYVRSDVEIESEVAFQVRGTEAKAILKKPRMV
ncbi:MAG: glycine cleavage system aminomethyltransferase GcvT [Thermoplasmatales archaeon]